MNQEREKYLIYTCNYVKERIRLLSACNPKFPETLQVDELEEKDWNTLTQKHKIDHNKTVIKIGDHIIFKKGDLCLKDLVKTILLTLSPLSKIKTKTTRAFIESMTELLAGYFMMNYEPKCYETWRRNEKCKVEHYEDVKTLYFFTLKIGIYQTFLTYLLTPIKNAAQLVNALNKDFNGLLQTKINTGKPIISQMRNNMNKKTKQEYEQWDKNQKPPINLKQIRNIVY